MSALPPAIFLMGPTAAGKTDLAIELTKVLPCELISVDSAWFTGTWTLAPRSHPKRCWLSTRIV